MCIRDRFGRSLTGRRARLAPILNVAGLCPGPCQSSTDGLVSRGDWYRVCADSGRLSRRRRCVGRDARTKPSLEPPAVEGRTRSCTMVHRMILNQTAWFGRGAVANIPAELIGKGYTKALVVTDPTLARNGVARRVTDHLDAAGFAYTVFDDVSANPTIENVQAGVAAFLPAAARGDAAAVEKMALGQYMAGMGFSNVGLGLVHAMAHPLGAFYGTPHGIANGVLLPHVMAFNGGYTGSKLRDIAKAMGVPGTDDLPLVQARQAAVDAVAALGHSLGVPSRLRDIQVVEADLRALATAAYADICRAGNPRPVSESDILTLFRAIF